MQPPRAEAVPERVDVDAMSNRAERFGLGSWIVVPARGLIRSHGVDHRLTPQQMAVLLCLVRRAGVVVSKEELLENVWSGAIVEEGALARCVSELRSALGDDARAPKYIQTVAGHGYRLIIEPKAVVRGTNGGEPVEDGALWGRSRRSWIALSAVLLLGLGAAIVLPRLNKVDRALQRDSSGEPMVGRQVGPVVAVLGFRNLSGDAASDWLATAMPELLANELAISDEVRVVPTQSVSRLTRDLAIPEGETLAPETLRQVKSALGVDFVVLGSFLRVPGDVTGEIRLDALFQDTRTASVVTTWTETVGEADVISSLSRAGLFLREALGVHGFAGPGVEVAAYLPKDPTALRLYYQGIRALRLFESVTARDYLTRSLALEPDQPFALMALSKVWASLGYDARAVEVAQRALGRIAGLPGEHRLLVEASYFAVLSKWSEAIERYRALWLLAPDNLDYAIQLARSQNSAGLPEEALATLGKVRTDLVSGMDPLVLLTMAESATRTGNHERALAAAREAAARAEVLGSSLMLAKARQSQALGLYGLGKVREASLALQGARAGFSSAGDHVSEARTLGTEADWMLKAGNPVKARGLLARSLTAFRDIGNRRGEAEALSQLGKLLSYQGDVPGARRVLTEATSTFIELEDRFGQATALSELAYAMGSNGRPQEAELPLREAAQIFEQIGALEQAAAVKSVLGMTLFVIARPVEGHVFLQQAENALLKLGSRHELGRVWVRMASSYWCLGELASAEESAKKAFDIGVELENPRIQGFALIASARVLAEKGKLQESFDSARQALAIAERLNMPTLDVAALARLVEVSLARNDVDAAVAYARQAVDRATATSKYVVGSYDLYARALAAAGDLKRAKKAVIVGAKHDDGFSDVSIELALNRLRLGMYEGSPKKKREKIDKIERKCRRGGHWALEMEAKIVKGELEGSVGNYAEARVVLEQVALEAEQRGWIVLAAKARRTLQSVIDAGLQEEPHTD